MYFVHPWQLQLGNGGVGCELDRSGHNFRKRKQGEVNTQTDFFARSLSSDCIFILRTKQQGCTYFPQVHLLSRVQKLVLAACAWAIVLDFNFSQRHYH